MIKLCTIYENKFELIVEKKQNFNSIEQIDLQNFTQFLKDSFKVHFLKGRLKEI